MSDTVARAYYEALITASKIVEQFEQAVGRAPTAVDHAIAASLFIEKNRANKPAQQSGGGGYSGGGRKPYVPKKCDVCESDCWDNRKKKRENPAEWGNAPDFACKNKACSSHKRRAAAPAGSPFDADDGDLPF